jgi:hypothetical protein
MMMGTFNNQIFAHNHKFHNLVELMRLVVAGRQKIIHNLVAFAVVVVGFVVLVVFDNVEIVEYIVIVDFEAIIVEVVVNFVEVVIIVVVVVESLIDFVDIVDIGFAFEIVVVAIVAFVLFAEQLEFVVAKLEFVVIVD